MVLCICLSVILQKYVQIVNENIWSGFFLIFNSEFDIIMLQIVYNHIISL